MKTKTCTKCKKEKSTKEFCVNRAVKDGLHYQCKECNKEYYRANSEKIKEQRKEYYKDNPGKIKQNAYKWRAENPEKAKQSALKWQAANPEKVKQIVKKYQAKITQTFWGYWNRGLGTLMTQLLAGTIKASPTLEWVLGCSSQQFIDHIISQLKPGMTKANYGKMWEIDHKISKFLLPYGSFDDPNFKKLWALENLQPLWKAENRKKGKK